MTFLTGLVTYLSRCQRATPKSKDQPAVLTANIWGGARYKLKAFTEQGVAMLSSVLRSKRAVQVNVEIMRASSGFAKC